MPASAIFIRFEPSKVKRLGHHADREDAGERATSAITGAAPVAGAATHAAVMNTMCARRPLPRYGRGRRSPPRAPLPASRRRQAAQAELDLVAGLVARKHLRIGVDRG